MEALIGPFVIIAFIFFLIAEFIGRSKHIGRGWTFILLLVGFIPGIIALASSPSARRPPTNGSRSHGIWGGIMIILAVLNVIRLFNTPLEKIEPLMTFIPFSFFMGLYLIQLSKGRIINRNPKFYFSSRNKPYRSVVFENPQPQKNEQYQNGFSFSKNLENLKNLRDTGLLTESEYHKKKIELNHRRIYEQVVNSNEYKQLKELLDQGLLTETEFITKLQILRNRPSEKSDWQNRFSNDLIQFTDHNLNYGFKDKNGNIVINPIFEFAENFTEGLALVRINRRFGFIDKYGNPIIKNKFNYAESFKNGRAKVKIKDREFFIDKRGREIFR